MVIKILLLVLALHHCCLISQMQKKSKIRGNYKDVLQFKEINLIKRENVYFSGGQMNSQLNRDAIYYVNSAIGYTNCPLFYSIQILLLKKYELNTIVVEIWDRFTNIHYDFEIYIAYQNQEQKIYENHQFAGVVRIHFQDQLVDTIRIYNRGGSNYNGYLSIIKAQAFYQLKNN